MWHADAVGVREVYRQVQEFHRRYGELWTPAPLLARLAAEGGAFATLDSSRPQTARQ
jgi:3-hydroxyacyl-CoA dehydrogenase